MSFLHKYHHAPEEEECGRLQSMSSPWRVPFSWEEEPGISKMYEPFKSLGYSQLVRPKVAVGQVPNTKKLPLPPPCAIQPKEPKRNGSQKNKKEKELDPFVTALMECTKTDGRPKDTNKSEASASGRRKFGGVSCKKSCDVRDNNLVRFQFCGRRLSVLHSPLNGRVPVLGSSVQNQREQKCLKKLAAVSH